MHPTRWARGAGVLRVSPDHDEIVEAMIAELEAAGMDGPLKDACEAFAPAIVAHILEWRSIRDLFK